MEPKESIGSNLFIVVANILPADLINELQLIIPKDSSMSGHTVTLKELVENKCLSVGTKIYFNLENQRYDGIITTTVQTKKPVFYSKDLNVFDETPSGFIRKIVGPERSRGRGWGSVRRASGGRTLKSIKEEYIKDSITMELIRIPGVWMADTAIIAGKICFQVCIDPNVDEEKLKSEYKILNDPDAVIIEKKEEPEFKDEAIAQYGSTLSSGLCVDGIVALTAGQVEK